MIFLSHALPEDNEFTRWLALRLAREGYPVWCELTKLLGGEDFWVDIEESIRSRTTKFLFVLSKTSNQKPGVLQELALAKRVGKGREDFVIPLKIDDLSADETTIELTRLNSIDFREGWVRGLAKLLEKLKKDGVPKDPRFNAAAVADWWQSNLYSGQAVIARSEPQACNWFPIRAFPQRIFLHSLIGEKKKPDHLHLTYPFRRFGSGVFSFLTPRELIQALQPHGITVVESRSLDAESFYFEGETGMNIKREEAARIMHSLLRDGFERRCITSGLKPYDLAGKARCFWFSEGFRDGNKVGFKDLGKKNSYRRMVGRSKLLARDGEERFRTWHFGIQPQVIRWPEPVIAIKSHVVFSEDGALYESASRQHSSRRSQCRMWHNDTWLARLLAAMAFLAEDSSESLIKIPLAENSSLVVDSRPLRFESPVSFDAVWAEGASDDDELDEVSIEEEEEECPN